MKKKNWKTVFILVLVEFIFFYRNGFKMSEMFFFVWFLIFGTLFGFRFIEGRTSLRGMGADPRFLTAKMSESMYVKEKDYKKHNDFSFDLIFGVLAVINLIISLISYYLKN